MCVFFSCLALKNGDVVWREGVDSHDELLQIAELTDRTDNPDRMTFARVEILPPDENPFETDLSKWAFKVDQSITPSWFSDQTKENCLVALRVCLDRTLIDSQELGDLENRNGLWVRNSKIGSLKNCSVREMRGNSRVGSMRETSKVDLMEGNSRIEALRENSRVGMMWENSSVGTMWKNSRVETLRDNSRVGTLWDNSMVEMLRGNSKVEMLLENSCVDTLLEDSSVGTMRGNSRVGTLWGNSRVGTLLENSRVGTMREDSRVDTMWGNSRVGTLWDNSMAGTLRGNSRVENMHDAALAIRKMSSGIILIHPEGLVVECQVPNNTSEE